ncbi:7960_t:CDS:2, partial [Acaulospora colombiana]
MNEEIKKKFCHLLMFDVSEPGQQQDAITTNIKPDENNEIGEEGITVAKEEIPQAFVYHPYDDGSIFKSSASAVKKGSSNVAATIRARQRKPRAKKPKRTPRPPNAFILYRKDKQPGVVAQSKNLTNAEVSKVISKMWWKETEEERFKWDKFADRMKLKHMQDHPDYVYQPKKPGTKKTRKTSKGRGSSISQSSSTATFSAISNSTRSSPLADEAMITAIAESAFAESRSSPTPFFLTNSSPSSPSSLPSPPQSEDGSASCERSPLMNQGLIQSANNLRVQQNLHTTQILYTHLPPTPTEMVHYDQYLLPSNDSLHHNGNNSTFVHVQNFGTLDANGRTFFHATPDYMSPHALNNHHGIDTYLDPQPVDKFNYYMSHEHPGPASYATIQAFNSDQVVESYSDHNGEGNGGSGGGSGLLDELFNNNTVTASATPENEDMNTYIEQQHPFPFSRRNSLCCSVSM